MKGLFAATKDGIYLAMFTAGVLAFSSPAVSAVPVQDRVIDLQGTSNTRDIGGYQTGDLRTVRSGQIIRSENLSRLTADDFRKLEDLGLKTVIDLRTNKKHKKEPTVWQGENPPQFYHFPVGDVKNDWFQAQRKLMKMNRFSEEQSLELQKDGYRMILEEGTASYQQLMEVVLDESNWPVLIHCNAGKDRAGVAVTLILEAIGVDRETIMQEYLLTNEVGRSAAKAELLARESRKNNKNRRGPSASAWYPIVGVHPEMLETFYAGVDEQYGSMDAFLNELGVDQEARSELISSLTVTPPELALGE